MGVFAGLAGSVGVYAVSETHVTLSMLLGFEKDKAIEPVDPIFLSPEFIQRM